ncbi:MAG: hypothetical protein K9N48_08930 [Verrucomicrobia bacterium]|nr:hypothetical protein [Verrucomicrobiota bacterium]MCF7708134.1 hypothetical protein [Verrucomicrobiota bacterium]
MRVYLNRIIVMAVGLVLSSICVNAQRGMGDNEGVVRQNLAASLTEVTGKVLEIKTGPCENTTGRALEGTHLIVLSDGKELNIHLGPAKVMENVVDQLNVNTTVKFRVFRTEKMEENAYIARSFVYDDTIVILRDENLRPVWANGRGRRR